MPLRYAIEDTVLANGMRVVVNTDHGLPSTAVNVWVKVGSRHEQPHKTGLAHLFEHLMFQGSEHVAEGEHFAAMLQQGARLNATTSFDRTNYFEMVPAGATELALWLEADRHGRLLPALTQDNLDNQRDVVKEEKRQRYDNVPYGDWLATTFAAVFPADHPYHHTPIGSMADLDGATLADVQDFYRAHYRPANTVLTLAGDLEAAQGFDLAQQYFGGLDNPPNALIQSAPQAPPLLPMTQGPDLTHRRDVPHDRIYLAFRLPPGNTPEFFAASLALDIVGGLASSRLEKRLVRGSEVATSVSAMALGLAAGTSMGLIIAEADDEHCLEAVHAQINEELARFAADGPASAEMAAAIAQNERAWLSSLASLPERADHINEFTSLYDDPRGIETVVDRTAAITAQEVSAAVSGWIQPAHAAVIRYERAADAADTAEETA